MSRPEVRIDTGAPGRSAAARSEKAGLDAFCGRYGLAESAEAITLYLTHHASETDASGRATRRRLQRLDLDRRLRGEQPWIADSSVRTFLRGLHASRPFGDDNGFDPLYVELVHALIDVTRLPTLDQRRGIAAALLVDATDLPVTVLARMMWDQVRLTRRTVTYTVTQKVGRGQARTTSHVLQARPGQPDCPVAAARRLRAASRGDRYVFGDRGSLRDADRLRVLLQPLQRARSHQRDPVSSGQRQLTLAKIGAPSPSQIRDRAALAIGYGAALRTKEATDLVHHDIEVLDHGLRLRISGRRHLTYIPSGPDPAYDPVSLWTYWLDAMTRQGRSGPDRPAFPACNFSVIIDQPLASQGLNHLIHQRCEQAALPGRHAWTSLRAGMIRTAIRDEARNYAVAAQADLASLTSIQRHEHRENLLRHSVAGMLGL